MMNDKITKEERKTHKEFLKEQKKLDKTTTKKTDKPVSVRKGVIN